MEWNWKKEITKEKLIELYVNQKKSMRDLAEIFDCERNTIRRHLKRHNITINYDHRDCLESKYWKPTNEQEGSIIGMVLGDASVQPMNECASCRLSFAHSSMQKDYFYWKVELLNPIFSKKTIHEYSYKRDSGTITKSIIGHTRASLYFRELRKMFYNEKGKKVVKLESLSKLTPQGLAIWVMDDGCCKRLGIELATCCFSYDEHILMRKCFIETYGIRPIIRKNEKQFVLFFNKVNSYKLIQIIKPYIHNFMQYKINLSITPQRLHVGLLREEKMIQSELYGNIERQAEMTCPSMI